MDETAKPGSVGVHGLGAQGASAYGSASRSQYGGSRGHRLMCPPVGYKFVPRVERVCGEMGCFECYDIYCERCESKDRRIIELEMRNSELVKHITLLQSRLFPRHVDAFGGTGASGATGSVTPGRGGGGGGVGAEPFACVQSPVLFDPKLGVSYQATTTFTPAAGQTGGRFAS